MTILLARSAKWRVRVSNMPEIHNIRKKLVIHAFPIVMDAVSAKIT